jgi:hypothetical protein
MQLDLEIPIVIKILKEYYLQRRFGRSEDKLNSSDHVLKGISPKYE